MADWGLQAVIRPNEYGHDIDDGHRFRHHDHDDLFAGSIDIKKEYYDQSLLFSFPHLVDQHHHDVNEKVVLTNELNQLYKPFYQVPDIQTDIHHHHFDQKIHQDNGQEVKSFCGSATKTSQATPKLKKRKNQQKRVVVQVTADGLSSDPWAWRKYGQKPIKGSIYPRSYYRCSTSKGCMARRQVEQSCTDSSIYILTYTAEHNHPKPTRRNSLAGINRGRLKATPKSPTTSEGCKTVTILSKDSPFHSPTPLSVSSNEDEGLQQSNIKHETTFVDKFDHNMMPGSVNDDDDYMVFSDNFFEGLEDFGGCKMESSSYALC
ncbi:WRKY transcription factor 22-like [Bidens hawaiensis]|uniref:WRKY transcription factor 22-like n=1 Tax=Bidens hawaiensis TaxID=980011 RepID=UPI00404A5325